MVVLCLITVLTVLYMDRYIYADPENMVRFQNYLEDHMWARIFFWDCINFDCITHFLCACCPYFDQQVEIPEELIDAEPYSNENFWKEMERIEKQSYLPDTFNHLPRRVEEPDVDIEKVKEYLRDLGPDSEMGLDGIKDEVMEEKIDKIVKNFGTFIFVDPEDSTGGDLESKDIKESIEGEINEEENDIKQELDRLEKEGEKDNESKSCKEEEILGEIEESKEEGTLEEIESDSEELVPPPVPSL